MPHVPRERLSCISAGHECIVLMLFLRVGDAFKKSTKSSALFSEALLAMALNDRMILDELKSERWRLFEKLALMQMRLHEKAGGMKLRMMYAIDVPDVPQAWSKLQTQSIRVQSYQEFDRRYLLVAGEHEAGSHLLR